MPETLEIRVNHERPNALEAPETFETTGDFDIEIINDGKPVHIHLNYDDDLAAGLSMEAGNHFIPRMGSFRLPVTVDTAQRPFLGKCRVSTGYGSETAFVEIRVAEPTRDHTVTVDESLARPASHDRSPPLTDRLLGQAGLLLLLGILVLIGLVGAAAVAMIMTPLVGLIVGILAVLLAVVVYLSVGKS